MRKLMTLALAATTVVLAACSGSDSTGPESIAGTYTLTTVNNGQLPFITTQSAAYKAEILASAITLKDDKTFSWTITGRETDAGGPVVSTDVLNGGYTLVGSVLTLLDSGGSTTTTLTGDTITMVIDGSAGTFTLVFRR